MFRSATFKLTASYLAIVMAISLFFSIALYHVAVTELARGLTRETERIYHAYPVFEDDPLLRSTPEYKAASHRILLQLGTFNALVLAGAGIASYGLARRTLEPIEQAHMQQQRFTADVSHELRTPLTALRMESEVALLNKTNKAVDLRHTLQSNLEEVSKLEALINNLLRLSQLEADELQQNFRTIDVSKLIASSIKEVAVVAHTHTVQVHTDNSLRQPTNISGDAASLQQLFVILLDNAIKYSPPNGVVNVSLAKQSDDAIVKIADSGSGIEQSELEHIFDRFYRADSGRGKSTAANTEGYGLGLSIAKMIADKHHSAITIASTPGKGTVASVQFSIVASA